MAKLAIKGGRPVREKPFPSYDTIGHEERRAVMEVLESGVLSKFLATWSDDFYGGERVRKLEREWSEYFGIEHSVTVNSATSGLYAAVGAAGVGPGDEVIVSPYTMVASATAAIVYGALPVFADIDPEIFCITPDSIRRCISPSTKAIIVVDLFGHPANMDEIMEIAQEHDLTVIEDAAQAPGALYRDRFAGTLGHMGVFSLNYHKVIHTGEGGVVVTDDDELAQRLQLIRNHAEAVVHDMGVKNLVNMVGFNFRMTEIEAAIGSEQLKKLDRLVSARVDAAAYITDRLSGLKGITTPVTKDNVRHVYYAYAMRFDSTEVGIPREKFVEALKAEGVPVAEGYVRPIYLEPMYQKRIAIGKDGFPFSYPGYKGTVTYDRGLCPVTEQMYEKELITTGLCHPDLTVNDLDDIVSAFLKVHDNVSEIRGDSD